MSNRLIVQEDNGRVMVALLRAGQFSPEASQPFDFAPPLKTEQLEDLRWYLEDYLGAPFAVYEERGQTIASQLNNWGEALFLALFGPGKPGHDPYLRSRGGGATELVLSSKRSGFLALPWELLKDPERADPVALAVSSFDRTFAAATEASEQASSGESLRVLMVIARPSGLQDIGYQMIARPLLHRLQAVRGKVQLDVVRPPSFDQLQSRLRHAQEQHQPYQVLHFDGHGSFGVSPGTAELKAIWRSSARTAANIWSRRVSSLCWSINSSCPWWCSTPVVRGDWGMQRRKRRWPRACSKAGRRQWWRWVIRSMRWRQPSS